MAEQNFYRVSDYGDRVYPGERLQIEHRIYAESNPDLSQFINVPLDGLQTMREESAAAEQAIFEKIRGAVGEWEIQAGNTLLLDNAIEYVRTPEVKHSFNQWGVDPVNDHLQSVSNSVYKMSYYVYEDTKYNRDTQQSIPVCLCLQIIYSYYYYR